MPDHLEKTLKSAFKLEKFRLGQREVIESVLAGKDTLAVMPTGGGKSLCYQMVGLQKEGITIVVSPLIALMQDQVQALSRLGIPAGCIYSGQTLEEKQLVFTALQREKHFILYVSPERVQKEGFEKWIRNQKVTLFAVDESHCISKWGPDFRKDYCRLDLLRQLKPDVPILALTATATPPVLLDISTQLQLKQPTRLVYGFYRPNLFVQVESCSDEERKNAWVRKALEATDSGRVLIYCGTRKQTEALAHELASEFKGVGFYHAGLSPEQRIETQENYQKGSLRILTATNAFGMGVDHPDVRLLIHFQMPANIESYYQEIGRAGRDGKPSTCLLLYSKKDKALHSYFIKQSEAEASNVKKRWQALDAMVQFSEGAECRHSGILTYFRDAQRIKQCGHCDICDSESTQKISIPFGSLKKVSKSKSKTKVVVHTALNPTQSLRADALRKWRKRYADENDMPAFLVFSNKTLEDLARKNPSTLDELAEVYGFGPHKVEHLGDFILKELSEF